MHFVLPTGLVKNNERYIPGTVKDDFLEALNQVPTLLRLVPANPIGLDEKILRGQQRPIYVGSLSVLWRCEQAKLNTIKPVHRPDGQLSCQPCSAITD